MFERGASVKEIEQTIARKQVAPQVNEVFSQSIETSTILSDDLPAAPTPDDTVQMIRSIVDLGFRIAFQEKIDLVLPGSPIDANSLCIFECSSSTEQDVEITDRSVTWNRFRAKLFIVPMSRTHIKKYWRSYVRGFES